MHDTWCGSLALVSVVFAAGFAMAQDASQLRLVPFPKEVSLQPGRFPLDRSLVLEGPAGAAELFAKLAGDEMRRAGFPACGARPGGEGELFWRLSARPGGERPSPRFREGATPEDYVLEVSPDGVVCGAPGPEGLFYGIQTFCQLVRANRSEGGVPCLTVRDWPSLRWRCFQCDLTRGPSPHLRTLEREIGVGSSLKMNLFTYYMEYQFAFQKHPVIGPKDGSLTPDELKQLVAFAEPLHVGILGNQQSFGHFERILAHKEYSHLGEVGYILSPVKEESYQLLDDLYSEVAPLLPFPFFNVCCDETDGLGKGASEALAKEIGVGGVYVRHIRRVHDLLRDKYGKRMMMWGDIILRHPDHLKDVPKDTIMLSWGYDAAADFEGQIVPFAESGYEFFVCPGVNDWSRVLPDFGVAMVNIRNFVRDGARHGALGMLNTEWKDDGESLNAPNWHGYAWGAECAWNASATAPEDFNRRVGAALFGEPGDHFGQAIELLAQTHRLPGMQGMNNARFWYDDFRPQASGPKVEAAAGKLLKLVRPAIEHLRACKKQATANAELLDGFIFGARRMELIGRRMLDGLEATQAYTRACEAAPGQAAPLIQLAQDIVEQCRAAHADLGKQFGQLWSEENRPYALDWTMRRYQAVDKRFDDLNRRLAEARGNAEAGRPIPEPKDIGLSMPEGLSRRTRPHRIEADPLSPDTPWVEPTSTHRLGLIVKAGPTDRVDLPIEVDVPLPPELASRPARAFCSIDAAQSREIPVQLDPSPERGKARLVCLVGGMIPKGKGSVVWLYLGLQQPPAPLPSAVSTTDAPDGMVWMENDGLRLLLGPEGAHIYRWELKALANRDLTMPGETGWAGFSDMASHYRSSPHKLACTARGPALVRYECVESQSGLVKTISLFAGASWVEVTLDEPTSYYWDFDDPRNFAADGPTPGTYLFSNGKTGPVARKADGVPGQVEAENVFWGIKSNNDRLALGIITPEVAARHHVAPGAGAGGVGIEASPAVSHFVTFAGLLTDQPDVLMNSLRQTLNFQQQPEVTLCKMQAK